jgi:hypothetical protein
MCFWVNHWEQGFRLLPFPELLHWRFQRGDDAQEPEYGEGGVGGYECNRVARQRQKYLIGAAAFLLDEWHTGTRSSLLN